MTSDSATDVELYDVADLVRGVSYRHPDLVESDQDGIPLLRATNIGDGALVFDELLYVPPGHVKKEQLLRQFDAVIAMSSGSRKAVGRLAQLRSDWRGCVGAFCGIIRPKEDAIHPSFLGYVLSSRDYRVHIDSQAVGTAIMNLSRDRVLSYRFKLPPPNEQEAIASVLGTLDDKIEQNRRAAQVLERLARAIFKAWFVDFEPVKAKAAGAASFPSVPQEVFDALPTGFVESGIGLVPEGWRVGVLGDVFKIGLGGQWGSDERSDAESYPARCLRGIDCHELAAGSRPNVPLRWLKPHLAAKRELADGVVLVEGSGSFCGRSILWRETFKSLYKEDVLYSNFTKRLDPLLSAGQATVGWYQMKAAYDSGLIGNHRTGSAFPNLDIKGMLKSFSIVIPGDSIASAFARLVASFSSPQVIAENCKLSEMRDYLLPKLLSGEVRAAEADRAIEGVA